MIIYPAIDLKEGQVVRLKQGLASEKTVYFENAATPAQAWKSAGAEWIHVVDLDGAFSGTGLNQKAIEAILASGLKIQLGGGIRSIDTIAAWIDKGVERVVIGTKAADDPDFLDGVFKQFDPKRIAIGIDAKDGKVAVDGWTRVLDLNATDFAKDIERRGGQTIIYTDIGRDGMLQGPNIDSLTDMLKAVSIDVIASGGISVAKDITDLRSLVHTFPNLNGAITGRALYDGRIELADIL